MSNLISIYTETEITEDAYTLPTKNATNHVNKVKLSRIQSCKQEGGKQRAESMRELTKINIIVNQKKKEKKRCML